MSAETRLTFCTHYPSSDFAENPHDGLRQQAGSLQEVIDMGPLAGIKVIENNGDYSVQQGPLGTVMPIEVEKFQSQPTNL